MSYIDEIMRAHPEWPYHIQHGEYVGVLSGIQPLTGGAASPVYRFGGSECVGVDYETTAVRFPAREDAYGIVHCGSCGALLLCNECGDMPDVYPACHEGVDWSAWKKG